MAKTLKDIRIEPVEKGGFIVHHSTDSGEGPYLPPTKHLFTTHGDLISHIAKVTKAGRSSQPFKDALKALKK